jgi:hypothetical protein
MANNITINVRAVVDKAVSEVDRMKSSLNNLSTSEGFKSAIMGVGISAGMMAFNAIGASIAGVGNVIGQLAKSGMEEEASISRLGASLKANVAGWDGNTAAIQKSFTAAQKLGFQDETLRDSLAVLVGATHDVAEAQRIQGIAMDLARYKHIDLQTASESLIKVEAGVYRSLKSLGIVLRDGATQAEAFAAVQAVAGGQAQASGAPRPGRWKRPTSPSPRRMTPLESSSCRRSRSSSSTSPPTRALPRRGLRSSSKHSAAAWIASLSPPASCRTRWARD